MESNYDKYVMSQTMGKFNVISVHLWLEYLLVQCLRCVVPNAEPLFRDRGMGFAQLVSLCEAHEIVDKPLAETLRKVNSLRNRCAHQLTFNPGDEDWQALEYAIGKVAPRQEGSEEDYSLRRLADHLEKRAVEIGALPPTAT
jgi:hypothetical protein